MMITEWFITPCPRRAVRICSNQELMSPCAFSKSRSFSSSMTSPTRTRSMSERWQVGTTSRSASRTHHSAM